MLRRIGRLKTSCPCQCPFGRTGGKKQEQPMGCHGNAPNGVCINASHVNLTCPGCYCPWVLGVVDSRGLLGCWHQLRRWHWLTGVIWRSSLSHRWVCWQLNEEALQQEWLQVASAMKWRWGAIRDSEITGSKRSRGRKEGLADSLGTTLHAGHILTASVQILGHFYLLPQFILAGNYYHRSARGNTSY